LQKMRAGPRNAQSGEEKSGLSMELLLVRERAFRLPGAMNERDA
jgi:hypothetical protein